MRSHMRSVGDGGEVMTSHWHLMCLEKGYQKKYPTLDVGPRPSTFCHLSERFRRSESLFVIFGQVIRA